MQRENGSAANLMFKKEVAPGHYYNIACGAGAMFMLGISLFSAAGLRVAAEYPDPWIAWVPWTLWVLSTGGFAAMVVRIKRRWTSYK